MEETRSSLQCDHFILKSFHNFSFNFIRISGRDYSEKLLLHAELNEMNSLPDLMCPCLSFCYLCYFLCLLSVHLILIPMAIKLHAINSYMKLIYKLNFYKSLSYTLSR